MAKQRAVHAADLEQARGFLKQATVMIPFDDPQPPHLPPSANDVVRQEWAKFINDLVTSFDKLEQSGVNAGICGAAWARKMQILGQMWFTMLDQEQKTGKQNLGERGQLTNSMKAAQQTYLKCLQIPPRKQAPPPSG